MDVLVFAAILVGLAAFVAAPLYRPGRFTENESLEDAGREATERALSDLEVDRASGLVDQASYERERASLETD